jgi:hypothetical protein
MDADAVVSHQEIPYSQNQNPVAVTRCLILGA